ncbi:MAG: tetratricopeptide repeat protein [Methanophagales archaeon]|nr:tetratricopeptide repeat protein [Methanophagales archaeon]
MFLLGVEANDALRENRLNDAEHSHKTIIRYLQTQTLSEPEAEPKIAVGYHQLGMIAEERQQFDVAEQWYRKALEIRERLGLERYAANDYHQLGMIAEERQQFDAAEQWYRKALEIYERLGLERDAADDYHQLGRMRRRDSSLMLRSSGTVKRLKYLRSWAWKDMPLPIITSWE